MQNSWKYAAFTVCILSAAAMDSDVMWIPGLVCIGSLLLLMLAARKEVKNG